MFYPFWSLMLTSMARLPLNTLPAFRTVAKLSNLRAAADELHLTHSAVSQQIRGLEEQLGFALDHRLRDHPFGRADVAQQQVVHVGEGIELAFDAAARDAAAPSAVQRLKHLEGAVEQPVVQRPRQRNHG